MALGFNADEVFEIAEEIEKNGVEFYQKAAASVSDPRHKQLLLNLSDMEMSHHKIFADMRASLAQEEKKPTVFDPLNESALYIKSLADMRIFFEKQIDLSSMESILISALSAEKDSIVFYLGMKDVVPQWLGKDKIDHIINEEKKHIQLLGGALLSLKK